MTFNQFTVFVNIAERLKITEAAQALHISQPTASKHLKGLEEDYGLKLFARVHGRLELTADGLLFLSHTKAILSHLQDLRLLSKNQRCPAPDRTLAIGGSYSPSAFLLPSILAGFRKSHSGVQIAIRTGTTEAVERLVRKALVEMAVLNAPARAPELASELLRDQKLIPFVAKDHPLSKKRSLSLRQLRRVPFIIAAGNRRSSTSEQILKAAVNDRFQIRIAMRCEAPEGVKTAVRKGMGMGLLYGDNVMPDIRRGEFVELVLPGIQLGGRTYLVYHKTRPLSRDAEDLLALLRRQRSRKYAMSPPPVE
ncbi:MAG: LysR family transcriptional regulator [Deltaproteobacteria bacterium]|nr:LysR family transcriptional regulator [Deltaproteobacteria bacterium]